ncbi:hypothetical protein [Streptomyces sp. NPDC000229]|uniref:hypothetical protein n=1 Tax=Streptomyces sp. NPDC000229 TaxID=3154247 RepID=UPI003317D421
MSRVVRVFTVGVLVISGAGYGATAHINGTTHATTPPSPYASQPPPPDCTSPGKHPADCPPPGDDCASPVPARPLPLLTGDPGREAPACTGLFVAVREAD